VELFARSAVGQLRETPRVTPANAIDGVILADACRWYAFRVVSIEDRNERTEIFAETIDRGQQRDFFGFNRAKHAVVEAAILASRIDFLDASLIRDEFERLAVPVAKTGGLQERRAFDFLRHYVRDRLVGQNPPEAATP
jgi:hypothetical protein